jgi:hypothetical protein
LVVGQARHFRNCMTEYSGFVMIEPIKHLSIKTFNEPSIRPPLLTSLTVHFSRLGEDLVMEILVVALPGTFLCNFSTLYVCLHPNNCTIFSATSVHLGTAFIVWQLSNISHRIENHFRQSHTPLQLPQFRV